MSYESESTKIDLDAKTAKWLLEDIKSFVADRLLRPRHVEKLVIEMTEGRFLSDMTTIVVADLGSDIYRLNGQHTATAVLKIAEANPDFSIPNVNLVNYTVSDDAELRSLYAHIDRGSARSNVDVSYSLLAGTADFADVTKQIINLLPVGLAHLKYEDSNKRKIYSGESAVRDIQGEYLECSKQIAAFLGGLKPGAKHNGHVFRGPVVGALYATFSVDYEDALQFWTAVANGVGFQEVTEPASRLFRLLTNFNIIGGSDRRSSKAVIGQEEMYRACLHAWNRYRQGGNFKAVIRPGMLTLRQNAK